MKREIKFRAWDNYNNKFFEPIYEAYNNKLEELNIGMSGDLSIRDMTNSPKHESLFPSRFILMQFTGLHDKNGKEIYEGDILRVDYLFEYITSEVYFTDSAWCIKGKKTDDWISKWLPEELEVIGNIYENKDLLYV